ncbi:FtsW/RodA/SpoVE family cell cycle protein [Caloramator proteoclasticus]|uniref:Cell division protein FtsW, lipid II flippase n=1 Tax=Caloramator proteoclasticus DSM 10124 TaxID=1121262 RepID=A0A1M4VBB5_9CLOT|nr:FtsW/RodA/SpoVE family cell cycle protein [Caloramator proteoclasticus]SHE66259.1 cell division protein FtsW, lipid II flippase [Caloramator proteoclasticus DSM 10124]
MELEKKVLHSIYFVTFFLFFNLCFITEKIDLVPLIFCLSSIILIAYSNFIIRKFYPRGDKFLFLISVLLCQIGIVMIYRLDIKTKNFEIPRYALKQMTWFTIGITIFMIILFIAPKMIRISRYKYVYIFIALSLLMSTLFIGKEIKGSKNWIVIGAFSFQPSEIAKFFIILYLASALSKQINKRDIIETVVFTFFAIGFLVLEKDLGAALIFFGIYLVMLYIATSDAKYVGLGLLAFSLGGLLSYFIFNHVRIRVQIWLNPWKYKLDKGYQICQSLFAIASGGLFGRGLGLGYPYLIPLAINDFIFSAIAEEFGLIGASALIILYFLLVYRGLRTAIYSKDNFSQLVAVGISSMLAFQVFVVIGGVTKMIPMTGITLPFVSYGGSSMLLNFLSLGVLYKISEGR